MMAVAGNTHNLRLSSSLLPVPHDDDDPLREPPPTSGNPGFSFPRCSLRAFLRPFFPRLLMAVVLVLLPVELLLVLPVPRVPVPGPYSRTLLDAELLSLDSLDSARFCFFFGLTGTGGCFTAGACPCGRFRCAFSPEPCGATLPADPTGATCISLRITLCSGWGAGVSQRKSCP